jgi:hypothetical protein
MSSSQTSQPAQVVFSLDASQNLRSAPADVFVSIIHKGEEHQVKQIIHGEVVPFNTEQEKTRLEQESFLLEPLYFPKSTESLTMKLGHFNLSALQFEDIETEETCLLCYDTEGEIKKFKTEGCSCFCFLHPECFRNSVKNYKNKPAPANPYQKDEREDYRKCFFCKDKNKTAFPLIKGSQKPFIQNVYPITQDAIKKYEKEFNYLYRMKSFYQYYSENVGDKGIQDIEKPYDRYLYNIFQFFYTDYDAGDDEEETLKRLYIADAGTLNELLIKECEKEDYEEAQSFRIIFRDRSPISSQEYKRLDVDFWTRDEIVEQLYDRLGDDVVSFPDDFIFNYCLQPAIRDAFGDCQNTHFRAIWEDNDNDLLFAMMYTGKKVLIDKMYDALDHITDECLAEILGFDGLKTDMRWIFVNGDEEADHNIVICSWNECSAI